MISQEQQIIDALVGWMQEVTWANGYRTNAGYVVFDDEFDIPDEPTNDCTLIIDQGSQAQGKGRWTMTIGIEVLLVLAPTDVPPMARKHARALIADIRDVLRAHRERRLYPAGVIDIRETKREIPRREPGANVFIASVTLEIDYSDVFKED